jgi:transcriptional regulator with XRE-family HTH domain
MNLAFINRASVARDLGYSRQHITQVLSGRSRPSPKLVQKLADAGIITIGRGHAQA